ncbi:MAG TPA: hypothetical protein VIF43_01610 [Patescibacteria group bacterium]|jgi:hypothetical protein
MAHKETPEEAAEREAMFRENEAARQVAADYLAQAPAVEIVGLIYYAKEETPDGKVPLPGGGELDAWAVQEAFFDLLESDGVKTKEIFERLYGGDKPWPPDETALALLEVTDEMDYEYLLRHVARHDLSAALPYLEGLVEWAKEKEEAEKLEENPIGITNAVQEIESFLHSTADRYEDKASSAYRKLTQLRRSVEAALREEGLRVRYPVQGPALGYQ